MKRITLILMTFAMLTLAGCREKGGDNPLITGWDTPFGMPPFGEIKSGHFKPAYEEAMRQNNDEIEAIVKNDEAPNFENVILALDNSGSMMRRVRGVFGMLMGAEATDELRAVEREMSPLLTAHGDNINLNPELFQKVKAVYDTRLTLGLDELQTRLTEKKYKDFVRSGAELDDGDKEKLRELNRELADAGIVFRTNLINDQKKFVMILEKDDVNDLPSSVRDAAATAAKDRGEDGKYAFTLDKASMLPFLTYSPRRDLREQLYKGYLECCNHDDENDNKQTVNLIAGLRNERARLLGYRTFAEMNLENTMAKTPENVYNLLDDLWTPALEGAKRELEEMRAIKVKETGEEDFESWDWWYFAEKVRKEKYDLREEDLSPYLGIDKVQQGIFYLCNRLYGITFQPVNVPVYNPECVTYEVLDVDGSHLGILMMDFHPRPGKRSGAWCSSYRQREFENGVKKHDPIVYIVCNFTRSTRNNQPALLTLDETETFFHEFGHALHNLFSQVPYRGMVGTATERDFVELPSQIMENWAFEPEMLRRYALHYSSGNIMPDALIEKIQRSAFFNQGFAMTEYLAASFSDMDIYSIEDYNPLDVNEYERQVLNEERGLIPQIAPRYRFPYFQHVFSGGYSAGYYGYKWAEVLDKDAYEAFAETGDIFDKEVATRFRREVLEKGGSDEGMTLYVNFRGKEPSREYLLYASGLKERPKKPVELHELPQVEDEIDE